MSEEESFEVLELSEELLDESFVSLELSFDAVFSFDVTEILFELTSSLFDLHEISEIKIKI